MPAEAARLVTTSEVWGDPEWATTLAAVEAEAVKVLLEFKVLDGLS